MYLLILLFPLLNFFIIFLFGSYLGRFGCCSLSVFGIFNSFLISLFIFYEVCINQTPTTIKLYNWVCIDLYSIQIGFIFDSICSIMFIIITFISLLVHLYSINYLSNDPYISRFFAYLSLFTFFMLFLVSSDNLIQLFMGWEGVGLCSYLLINFWFTRVLANKAALKAMLINRIADVFFLIGILFLFLKFKTTDFFILSMLMPFILNDLHFFLFKSFNLLELIAFFLTIGAIGKSAQILFHTWLPDAMEGPTPVSALLHAATMVTAGVFLIIRCSFIFEFSSNILNLLLLIGSISTLFAGLVAIFQYDIKRVIAYSTCSQLGYMFIACGLSNYNLALYHLFNHAFFKALLFLSAGSLIHAFVDDQDMRQFGGKTLYFMPLTYICFIIGSFAIMGFPFLTGFYSKEIIITLGIRYILIDSTFCFIISILSALFTAIYSLKVLLFIFLTKRLIGFKSTYKLFNKYDMEYFDFMSLSMIILSIFSITIGYLFNDIFFGLGSPIFNNSICIHPNHYNIPLYNFLPYRIKDIPLLFTIIAVFVIYNPFFVLHTRTLRPEGPYGFFFYYPYLLNRLTFTVYIIANICYNAFFFNHLYNEFFIFLYKFFYKVNVKFIDKGFFEYLGPYSLYNANKFILFNCTILFYHKINFTIFIKFILILIVLIFINYCLLDYYILSNLGIISILLFLSIFNSFKL